MNYFNSNPANFATIENAKQALEEAIEHADSVNKMGAKEAAKNGIMAAMKWHGESCRLADAMKEVCVNLLCLVKRENETPWNIESLRDIIKDGAITEAAIIQLDNPDYAARAKASAIVARAVRVTEQYA